MTSIKRHVVLFDDSAADTGDWVRLDTRYDTNAERAININLTTGDTITIEGVVLDAKDAASLVVASADIGVLGEYTENATDALIGNWTYIRVVKAGTAGNAKVQGYV